MNRQSSASSTNKMVEDRTLEGFEGPVLKSTAIPIREEFRCRKFWLFYHDLRAFTTSWIPLPVYLVWRLFVAVYIFIWLILHIVARNDEFGPRWLIYLTNLAYIFLVIGTAAMCFLCIGYTIVYYTKPEKLVRYFPKIKIPIQAVYQQDNIPWFVKLCWFFYIIGASLAPLVTAGYWILVYRPVCSTTGVGSNVTNTSMTNITVTTAMTTAMPTISTTVMTDLNITEFELPEQGGNIICAADIDVYTLHLHGINAIIVLLDIFLSRIPYQFLHFYFPLFFQLPYVIFTGIYFGAGGTNPVNEMRYIYSPLNYFNATGAGLAIALLISPIPIYLLLFLLALLRDVISKHVSCCYRDVQYEEYVEDNDSSHEPETTKL